MAATRAVLVRGRQLRDEYVCPITRELLRDPVMAADGHTYERVAIEKWLVSHRRSPKTQKVMESNTLFPNINLLKLIRDLVAEGGEGLYVLEDTESMAEDSDMPGGYQNALLWQKVLTLKCLGPADSSWNNRSFRVFPHGVLGGRRTPTRQTDRDHIAFGDATVSRRHFEIIQNEADFLFYIRDLGSAGGTFLRVQEKEKIPVFPGLMFMVGKHQMIAKDMAQHERDDATHVGISMGCVGGRGDDQRTVSAEPAREAEEDINSLEPGDIADFHRMRTEHSCVLECFAPEGTPMQGKTFEVERRSVSLGRKQINDVSFSQLGDDGVCLGIDSSVSGIHSRIEYDEEEDALQLMDGSASKPSTNGTWVRLSKMHTRSKFFPLRPGVELLIGTVRFITSVDEVIVEKAIREDDALMKYAQEVAEREADQRAQAKRTPKSRPGSKEQSRPRGDKEGLAKPFLFKNRPKRRENLEMDADMLNEEAKKETATEGFREEFRKKADDRRTQDSPRVGTSETDESQDKVVVLSEEYGTDDEMNQAGLDEEVERSSCKD